MSHILLVLSVCSAVIRHNLHRFEVAAVWLLKSGRESGVNYEPGR